MSNTDVTFEIKEEKFTFEVQPQDVNFNLGTGITVQKIGDVNDTYEELLIGEIDNENKVFTTTYDYELNSTQIYKNGLRQRRGVHFTETGIKEITFTNPPEEADEIIIVYRRK